MSCSLKLASPKSSRLNPLSAPPEDAAEHPRDSWDGKVTSTSGASTGGRMMSDVIQRRVCIAGYRLY